MMHGALRPWILLASMRRISSYAFTFKRVLHHRQRLAFSTRMGGNLSSQRANILPRGPRSLYDSSLPRKLTTSRCTQFSRSLNALNFLGNANTSQSPKPKILTPTPMATGFIKMSCSGGHGMSSSISLAFVRLPLGYARALLVSPAMRRRKGDITGSLSLPWTRESVSSRKYQHGWPGHLG